MKVVRTARWERRMGYLGQRGVEGQVTVIECLGVTAYVRENIRMDTFMMSSQERLGVVGGHVSKGRLNCGRIPKHAQSVLELAAPKLWTEIAAAVHEADSKQRPVYKSNRWTVALAEELLKNYETHTLHHAR